MFTNVLEVIKAIIALMTVTVGTSGLLLLQVGDVKQFVCVRCSLVNSLL
jgi:hypothetical protein